MNLQLIAVFISVANFVLMWGVTLYMYLSNKNKATNDRINVLEKDIRDKHGVLEHRVTSVESVLKVAPDHDDLGKLYVALNKLSDTVNILVGENKVQSENLKMILNQIAQKGMK